MNKIGTFFSSFKKWLLRFEVCMITDGISNIPIFWIQLMIFFNIYLLEAWILEDKLLVGTQTSFLETWRLANLYPNIYPQPRVIVDDKFSQRDHFLPKLIAVATTWLKKLYLSLPFLVEFWSSDLSLQFETTFLQL